MLEVETILLFCVIGKMVSFRKSAFVLSVSRWGKYFLHDIHGMSYHSHVEIRRHCW